MLDQVAVEPGVYPGEVELRGDQHQRQQEQQGARIEMMPRLVHAQCAAEQQQHRSATGDPAAVYAQAADAARGHAQVGENEQADGQPGSESHGRFTRTDACEKERTLAMPEPCGNSPDALSLSGRASPDSPSHGPDRTLIHADAAPRSSSARPTRG